MQVDFYSADASGFLEFAQIKFGSKKPFCLPEDCADYVGFFHDAFDFESCMYNILYSECL